MNLYVRSEKFISRFCASFPAFDSTSESGSSFSLHSLGQVLTYVCSPRRLSREAKSCHRKTYASEFYSGSLLSLTRAVPTNRRGLSITSRRSRVLSSYLRLSKVIYLLAWISICHRHVVNYCPVHRQTSALLQPILSHDLRHH